MGGGGGGYSVGPGDMEQLKREVEERTERSMADAEVNDLLVKELIEINFRDADKTAEYLDALVEALGDDVEVEKLLFGGSIAKHTYVNGISDVDSLAMIRGDLGDLSPADLRQKLTDALNAKLPKGEIADIKQGDMAVTVVYRDGTEIQLLPAREQGGSTEISSADGTRWKAIDPERFARTLTKVNQKQGNAVIPTIKLAKGIIDQLPKEAQLSGYHVEALAVAAFNGYKGPKTPKEMLSHFFSSACEGVKRPIGDTTGQSKNIDESLGVRNSPARQAAANGIGKVASKMKTATSADEWRDLLGS